MHEYKHVFRQGNQIALRPVVRRGRAVNRAWDKPFSQMLESYNASNFDTQAEDEVTTAANGNL